MLQLEAPCAGLGGCFSRTTDRVVLKPYGFNYPNYGVYIYIYTYTYTYITFLIFSGKQIGS